MLLEDKTVSLVAKNQTEAFEIAKVYLDEFPEKTPDGCVRAVMLAEVEGRYVIRLTFVEVIDIGEEGDQNTAE